jgi:hypothetical protein
MLGRTSALLLSLAGCDRVWGLDDVAAIDAAHIPCRDPGLTGDEDGDRDVDGCDPCPADPEHIDVDSDGDQVDDICDPHPQTAGDRIVLFDSMATDLHYSVTTALDDWAHRDGEYLTLLDEQGYARLAIAPTSGTTVDAIFTSIAGTGHAATAGISLTLGATVADCAYEVDMPSGSDQLVIRINSTVVETTDFEVSTSVRFHLTQNADGSIDCMGTTPSSVATVHYPPIMETAATMFGFVTIRTHMAIDSVTVFGTN